MAPARGVEQQPRGLDRPTAHYEQAGPDLLVSLRLPVHQRGGADQPVGAHEELPHQRVRAHGETAGGQGGRKQRVRSREDRADVAAEHPDAFSVGPNAALRAHHLGWSLHGDEPVGNGPAEIGACLRALPSRWRVPALLSLCFAEDFAVIDAANGHIPWLAVCLPSHWAPEDKVGRHFAEVHAPVADNALLIAAGPHLMQLVTGAERWERFVWTITRSPRLRQHPAHDDAAPWPTTAVADADQLAAKAFFRTERQTFLPVPSLAQAIFTIHVETRPLMQAVAAAADARRVHDALASMSAAVLAYRGLTPARDRLLAWLAVRATASEGADGATA